MNIALISQEYPPETPWGGIGTQTRNKARGLAARGHTVYVLTRAAESGPEVRTEVGDGVVVHRMQPPGYEFPIYGRATYAMGYAWYVLHHLNKLMETVAFDIFDFPEYGGEGLAYLLDRTAWNWVPTVVQLHGPLAMFVEHMGWPEVGSRYHAFGTFAEKLCITQADGLMACSTGIADLTTKYYGIPRASIDVVHCGVDAEQFTPPPAGMPRAAVPTVLFVGNIVENKGIHTAIEAVIRLRGKYPNIRLQVLGKVPEDNELMERLRERLRATGSVANVDFAGFTPPAALPAHYRQAHVFCSPAEYEGGVANVYLEAMACGCPVVASTAGGAPDAVIPGATGFLVPPNGVEETAAALDAILGDGRLRDRLGVIARQRVEDYFATEHYVERVLAVYAKTIAKSHARPERHEDIRD